MQIGSSIQIFLFVLPFLVCLAWGLGKELTLSFDVFETVVGMYPIACLLFPCPLIPPFSHTGHYCGQLRNC
jgi:Ca2+/H+ antiporter